MQTTTAVRAAIALVSSMVPLWAASAVNDSFNNRIILVGTNLTATGSNTNAAKQNGEPNHAGNPGGKSVWWAWTAPTNGDLTITTDGSDFDTLLGVYTGSSVSALSLVASNDDHGVFDTSRVRFQATNGVQYQIAVDGYNDGTTVASGDIVLTLAFIPEPIARPPNDNFANHTPLTGLPVVVSGTNLLATREPGEPLHVGKYGDTSVWWGWIAPGSATVVASTAGSTFDTLLAVYTGTVLTNLSVVATNDDVDSVDGILTSEVSFDAVAGRTYQIAVDGYDGAAGQVVLSIGWAAPRLTNPTPLPDGNFQFTVSSVPGGTNGVDATSDLLSWTNLGTVVNTYGLVVFTDLTATNSLLRFYRAIRLP
jgi:hypothetical protein